MVKQIIPYAEAMLSLMDDREKIFCERIEALKAGNKIKAQKLLNKYKAYGRALLILTKKVNGQNSTTAKE